MKLVRPHSPTQLLRIFVIVHLSSFLVTKSILDTYYKPAKQKRQQIHRKASSVFGEVPSYQDATDVLEGARSRSTRPANQHYLPGTVAEEIDTMAPRGKGENTKKVAGNVRTPSYPDWLVPIPNTLQAKKAEVAAQKAAAADAAAERSEQDKWSKGAKSNDKKAAEAEKKAAAAAAKAERDRLLAEEEKNQPSKPKGAGKKTAEKKTAKPSRGTLDLGDLDNDDATSDKKETTLNATGIDNALDALSLTSAQQNSEKVERHPERRFKAAYKAYEERRLPEIESEHPGLRRNQMVELVRKEFEKSEENPFNQASVGFDADKEEVKEVKRRVREGVEGRLGEK